MERFKRLIVNGYVTDLNSGESVCLVFSTDIDPEIVFFWDFFSFFGVEEVNGAPAGHTAHDAIFGKDIDAPTGDGGEVYAADRFEVEKAVIIDVGDEESEFVHMAGHHDDGCVLWAIETSDAVADGIFAVGVGERLEVRIKDSVCLSFVAGGGAGLE